MEVLTGDHCQDVISMIGTASHMQRCLSFLQAGDNIVMAPSGVQKERMEEADMFVLDTKGQIIETPVARPPPAKPPKLSECSPLFMAVSHAYSSC